MRERMREGRESVFVGPPSALVHPGFVVILPSILPPSPPASRPEIVFRKPKLDGAGVDIHVPFIYPRIRPI